MNDKLRGSNITSGLSENAPAFYQGGNGTLISKRPTFRRTQFIALVLGLLCHGSFLVAISLMAYSLYWGFSRSLLPHMPMVYEIPIDALLLLQFPLLHSWFLGAGGRKYLTGWLPAHLRTDLSTTLFATFASLQLTLAFSCWLPLGEVVWWMPSSRFAWVIAGTLHISSWLFLVKALYDAGLSVQTGYLGWLSVFLGRKPVYPPMPERGLFSICRQPIYMGFFLVLLTAPAWTLDHLLMLLLWGAYCFVGPVFKERRFRKMYGERFEAYQARVPYMVPKLSVSASLTGLLR